MKSIKDLMGGIDNTEEMVDAISTFNAMTEINEYKEYMRESLKEIPELLAELGEDGSPKLREVLINTKGRYELYLSEEVPFELIDKITGFFSEIKDSPRPSAEFFKKCRKDVAAKSDRMLQSMMTKFSMVQGLENMFGAFAVELAGRNKDLSPMDVKKLSLEYQDEIVDNMCYFLKTNYLKFQTKDEMSIPRVNSMLAKLLSRGFLVSRSLFYNYFEVPTANYSMTFTRNLFESEKQMFGRPTPITSIIKENIPGTEETIEGGVRSTTRGIATNPIASEAQMKSETTVDHFAKYPKGRIDNVKPTYRLIQS